MLPTRRHEHHAHAAVTLRTPDGLDETIEQFSAHRIATIRAVECDLGDPARIDRIENCRLVAHGTASVAHRFARFNSPTAWSQARAVIAISVSVGFCQPDVGQHAPSVT